MKSKNSDRYLEQEFMRPDCVNGGKKNGSATLDRREADRVAIHSQVFYASEDDACIPRAEGQLLNLSKVGCRIVGPAPVVGSHISTSLDLKDGRGPLQLAGATVSWSDGYSFGVNFPSLVGEERQRLQELVLKLASLHGTTNEYKAFRVA